MEKLIITDAVYPECIIQITGCGVEIYALSNYGNIYNYCDNYGEWFKVDNIPFEELNKEE